MKSKFIFIILISLLLGSFIIVKAEEPNISARDIMIKVDNRPDGNDRKTTMKMTLINRRGRKRIREVISYLKDYGKDKKSIMVFRKPADVKGVGFLSWSYDNPDKDDDKWLYLPALKKIRRISGSSKNDYFMGTDFTYDDMGDRSVDDDTYKLLKEEKLNNHECWVIEAIPKDKDDMYSKKIIWVRKNIFITTKVKFYDKWGSLLKILTVSNIKKQDGFWTAFKMEMDNKQENHKTILEMKKVQYNQNLKNSLFRVSTLERGRIR